MVVDLGFASLDDGAVDMCVCVTVLVRDGVGMGGRSGLVYMLTRTIEGYSDSVSLSMGLHRWHAWVACVSGIHG